MIPPIVYALMLYSTAGWITYKAYSTSDLSRYLIAALLTILGLRAWPIELSGFWCLLAVYVVALAFLPFFKAKGLLKTWRVIWIYSVLGICGVVGLIMWLLMTR
jgi:hypothetical protein